MKKPFRHDELSNVHCSGCGKRLKKNLVIKKVQIVKVETFNGVVIGVKCYKCWLLQEFKKDGRSVAFYRKARRELNRKGVNIDA